MTGADRSRRVAGEVPHDRVLRDRHLRVEHGDVDLHGFAGLLAMQQRGVDADRREEPGRDVADRGPDPGRWIPGMAGDAHQAAHRLGDQIERGIGRVRSGVTEARGRGIDQPWMARVQALPPEIELFHAPRTIVLDEHVGAGEQAMKDGAVVLVLEIERDALLAAVDRQQIARLAVVPGTDLAREISSVGMLDLDDAGAEVAEDQRADRAGEHAREVDDRGAGEWSRNAHGRGL